MSAAPIEPGRDVLRGPTPSGAAAELRALLDWLAGRPQAPTLKDDASTRRLLASAHHHRVATLLYRRLQRADPARAAPAPRAELHRFYLANAAANLLHGVELARVLALLQSARIDVIPYKGLAVSLMAYGDESARQVHDLDLLVRPADYEPARRLLEADGRRRVSDWGWECTLVDPGGRLAVDLHRSITAPDFRFAVDFDALYARRVALPGRNGPIHSLCAEDLLIVLCVQVVKDGWARRCLLAKICDIDALVRARADWRWDRLRQQAGRLGCRRVLSVGLMLAADLLATPLPPETGRRLLGDPHARDIAHRITADLSCGARPAEAEDRGYYGRVRERWRDRWLPRLRRDAERLLVPNERDRALVDLPAALAPLYYTVRPVRLLRDGTLRLFQRRPPAEDP